MEDEQYVPLPSSLSAEWSAIADHSQIRKFKLEGQEIPVLSIYEKDVYKNNTTVIYNFIFGCFECFLKFRNDNCIQ